MMKLIDWINRQPAGVGFGHRGGGSAGGDISLAVQTDPTNLSLVQSLGTTTSLPPATTAEAGVMSAADKTRLDAVINHAATRAEIAATTVDPAVTYQRTAGHTTVGDGGAAVYVRVPTQPTHAGKVQSADGAWWALAEEHGGFAVEQFGAKGDGVTDDAAAFTSAIAALTGNVRKNLHCRKRLYRIGSAVTVPWNVSFRGQGARIVPAGNHPMFVIEKGGSVHEVEADTLAIAGYSSDVFRLFPAGVPIQGQQTDLPWVEGCKVSFAGTTGRAFFMDGSLAGQYIQYMAARDLVVDRGAVAFEMNGAGAGSWCNGNRIDGLIVNDCVKALVMNNANGNAIGGLMRERNAQNCAVEMIGSSRNIVQGIGWDSATFSFDAGSAHNTVSLDTSDFVVSSDSGRSNRVLFAGGEKIGNVSRSQGNDYRHGYDFTPGRQEFLDDFMAGPASLWTVALGAGTASTIAGFEGAAGNQAFVRRYQLNPNGTGAMSLTFGDRDVMAIRNNPVLHLTFNPIAGVSGVTRTGLAATTAGAFGCYFETDPVTHGNNNLRFVVANGGSRTVQDTGVSANSANLLFFATVEITGTAVTARLGHYNKAAGNDDGKIRRGIRCIYDTTLGQHDGVWTITTNIPLAEPLQPIAYVSDSATTARLQLTHFHCLWGGQGGPV